jgi:hypothetical protein
MHFWTWTLSNLTVLFAAAVAKAADPVSLTWNAPQGCPSRDAVLADVQRILSGPTNRVVVARADVTEIAPEHWSVHLVTDVDGAQGERAIDANSCSSLATATALILAWTVDPSKAVASLPPHPEEVPSPSVTSTREEPAAGQHRPGASGALAGFVAAGAAADRGTLPSIGVAGEFAAGLLFGPLRVEISGADWFTQRATTTILNVSEGTDIHLLEGALRGCFRWLPGPSLELAPCLGGAMFFASGDGFGTTTRFQPQHFSGQWGAVQAEVLGVWRLFGPIALRGSAGLGIPLARPPIVIDVVNPPEEVSLHRTDSVFESATLGVEARFP